MILTVWVESQAQEIETCYNSKQIGRINDFRKECEKCKLDLTDTVLALKDARSQVGSSDHSLTIVVGILMLFSGWAIGSSLK